MKKDQNYIILRKGDYYLPEIYGDELKNWLDLIPNPLSADFYTPSIYPLMREVLELQGVEKYFGYDTYVTKVNVDKLGNKLGIRFLNTKRYKSIYLFFDQKDHVMRGAAFEMKLSEKGKYNLQHQIIFKNYKKVNGFLLPTKIERHNVGFIRSGLNPQQKEQFSKNIDDQLENIKKLRKQCTELAGSKEKMCNEYWDKAHKSYKEIRKMFDRDHFILNYEISGVKTVNKDNKIFQELFRR